MRNKLYWKIYAGMLGAIVVSVTVAGAIGHLSRVDHAPMHWSKAVGRMLAGDVVRLRPKMPRHDRRRANQFLQQLDGAETGVPRDNLLLAQPMTSATMAEPLGNDEVGDLIRQQASEAGFDVWVWSEGGELVAAPLPRTARATAGGLPPHRRPRLDKAPRCKGKGWTHVDGVPGLCTQLDDGRTVVVRPQHHRGVRGPLWAGLMLLVFACVMGAGAFVLARRITYRLEQVDAAMQAFGQGDLTRRAPVLGQDEVAQLASTFNATAEDVQGLLEQQKRMLASASHELRTPLARLRMALHLLGDNTTADAERAQLTRDASADINELDELVGDLLAAARADDGRALEATQVNLAELVQQVAQRYDVDIIKVDSSLTCIGDRRLLARALRNLADNATRYGGRRRWITVDTTGADYVDIVFADDGAALESAVADQLFEPFYRPQGHNEGADGGVGLGLSLVRQIAEAHGGKAFVQREQNATPPHNRFVLRLPTE